MNQDPFIPQTSVEKYFYEISQIPRESNNERGISDYLVDFAKKKGLWAHQDEVFNVIIRKPASEGYEDVEPVMLQAHMDMVCVKASKSSHNFVTDPLRLYVEDGKLMAKESSLGGDDGYGVAFMLAVLEDTRIVHPELECVFTVQEETNMLGANHFDASILKSKRMINLDGDKEYSTYVSSYCSDRITLKSKYYLESHSGNFLTITIDEMEGSSLHGVVHQECSNAIKIMARVIKKINDCGANVRLIDFTGGKADNANPIYCKATLSYQNVSYDQIENTVKDEFKLIFKEFENDEYKGSIKVEELDTTGQVASVEDTEKFINLITLFPNNLFQYDVKSKGVISINNLGLATFSGGEIELVASARSKYHHAEDQLISTCESLARLSGYEMTTEIRYRPWKYNPSSQLRALARDIINRNVGGSLTESICPGGLEIAVFSSKIEGLDVYSLGIQCEGLHTINEAFSLESFNRSYQVLLEILKELKTEKV